jgi:phage-related minor tail protein
MTTEKFTVDGNQIVEKIKELVHQGNIRRVRLIHKGRPLIDIPLTVGVGVAAVTALAAPVLAALGAIAALVTECTIEVERIEETPGKKR